MLNLIQLIPILTIPKIPMTPDLLPAVYVVSTPIGNLEDITLRALSVLKNVDYIVCEDTRHSGILLKKYDIKKPLLSYHGFSDQAQIEKIVGLLKTGKCLALISDAGTPGLSDPGYRLLQRAIGAGIRIVTIPGPSALLSALPCSGLPMDAFLYIGFLPLKKGRNKLLGELAIVKYTIVIYESPHRLLRTLEDLKKYCGSERKMAICRELTKIHEQVLRGTVAGMVEFFTSNRPRGEFVLVIGGRS